jgi:hypothetical protein
MFASSPLTQLKPKHVHVHSLRPASLQVTGSSAGQKDAGFDWLYMRTGVVTLSV